MSSNRRKKSKNSQGKQFDSNEEKMIIDPEEFGENPEEPPISKEKRSNSIENVVKSEN